MKNVVKLANGRTAVIDEGSTLMLRHSEDYYKVNLFDLPTIDNETLERVFYDCCHNRDAGDFALAVVKEWKRRGN